MATKKKRNSEKKLLNYLQVQTMYLTVGSDAIKRLLEAKKVTPETVRKAAAELRKTYEVAGNASGAKTVDMLTALVDKFAPRVGKGKRPPAVGEERQYKTQVIQGKHTMRLPLDTLISQKGKVAVKFEDDRIIITKVVARGGRRKKAAAA